METVRAAFALGCDEANVKCLQVFAQSFNVQAANCQKFIEYGCLR
jgi:hypothetical protein